ncbi:MAG: PDZ domain-containing protein [Verrucomicrobiota bacterium]|nr:PDZ domain-containing protein [Verrucomicrobiota bacterium]
MKKIIKKIKQPTISILAFAVGLIVCVSFSSAETQIRYVSDELADEGSGEDSKNLIEKFGDQLGKLFQGIGPKDDQQEDGDKDLSEYLGKLLERAQEFWTDELDNDAPGKGFGLDLDLNDPRMADLMQFYQAQLDKRRPSRNEKDHRSVFAEYKPVVEPYIQSTARIINEKNKQLSLATVVSHGGLLVTKASELPKKGIVCELSDGRRAEAKILSTDARWDIALIKVELLGLKPVNLDGGKQVELGTFLAASGLDEYPIAVGVASVAPRNLSANERGFLGIGMQNTDEGVKVNQVQRGSGAAEAGIEVGDIILKIDGKSINSPAELAKSVSGRKPKEEIKILLRRGDDEKDLKAILGSRGQAVPQFRGPDPSAQFGGPLSKNRKDFPNALQHDLTLRPNECGGPLIDLDGKLVGVNIARGGRVKSYAIPAVDLRAVIAKLNDQDSGTTDVGLLEKDLGSIDGEIDSIENSLRDIRKRREVTLRALEEFEAKLRDIKKKRKETRDAIEKAKSSKGQ